MCSNNNAMTGGSSTAERLRPLEALEREITQLTSQIHAATCRWLCLIAEYDERRGWAEWGCKSCAHWVMWQCGIAPGPAREHVRVARRLQELPLIRAAFADGELSYSKVRALTRLPHVEREPELLLMARNATASQLERIIRGHGRVVAAERVAAGERRERWLCCEHDHDGDLLLHGRLPAEEGALVLAALDAARDMLARKDVPAEMRGSAASPVADVPAGTRVAHESGTAGVPTEASCAIESVAEGVPAGTPSPSAREVRADALLALADAFLAGAQASRTGAERHQVVLHVDTATLTDGGGQRCELADGEPLAPETARRLACDASIVQVLERDGVPLKLGRRTRTVPPTLRRALAARDRHCRYPGCTTQRFVDAHHISHWAAGGPTNLDNLIQLCHYHHRLLHEGRYQITRRPGGRVIFSRRDGRRIPTRPAGPPGPPPALRPTRRPDACVSVSTGEPYIFDWAVEALLEYAPATSGEPPGV
jgi:hypothetical protein